MGLQLQVRREAEARVGYCHCKQQGSWTLSVFGCDINQKIAWVAFIRLWSSVGLVGTMRWRNPKPSRPKGWLGE
jgi:hypothetical protein